MIECDRNTLQYNCMLTLFNAGFLNVLMPRIPKYEEPSERYPSI